MNDEYRIAHFSQISLSPISDIGAASQANLSSMFPTRSDIIQAVQPQKTAKGLKFLITEEEELHYLCSKNKDTDQLHVYHAANLHLCFRMCKMTDFV